MPLDYLVSNEKTARAVKLWGGFFMDYFLFSSITPISVTIKIPSWIKSENIMTMIAPPVS